MACAFRSPQAGFSLIEVLVAMAVILVGVLGTVGLLERASAQSSEAKTRQTANALIRDVVETAQGAQYAQLTSTSAKTTLQSNGFPDDVPLTTGSWEVKRNGITFTMGVSACIVDDPRDGQGTHASDAGFCSDSPAGSGDSNPDDYRRVTLTATPPAGVGDPLTQTTIVGSNRITNPGGTGPGGGTATSNDVKELKIVSPTLHYGQVAPCSNTSGCTFPIATTSSVSPKSVTFQVTTAYTAQKLRFTVDGQPATTISGPGTVFSWTWNLPDGQPDGNYVVAAQIFDSAGTTAISSPSPLVVTVNRYVPDSNAFAPTAAGRNPLWNNLPEIETYPTADTSARVDRDVTGFLATRQVNGTGSTVVCQTYSPNVRGCQDTSPPTCCGSSVTYRITPTGANPDGSQQTGGITAASRNVNLPNTRPQEPENVVVTRNGTRVTISWTNPAGSGDPDAGDCIDFFRVYRRDLNGTTWEYADRIDRTTYGNAVAPCGGVGELSNSITLNETTSATKRYRITAVDTNLAESPREQVTG
ncbi:MAG TPA: prepilin-type N-terminal cleavage/methylation domain-containing protein [Thermoleophilaceae bacterium]|jgi:prepilin-type N-terminal cleavage/methylation domain-containing protein